MVVADGHSEVSTIEVAGDRLGSRVYAGASRVVPRVGVIAHSNCVVGQAFLTAVCSVVSSDFANNLSGSEISIPPGVLFLGGMSHRVVGTTERPVALLGAVDSSIS